MALEDIEGSIGYASALARTGIITEEERNEIHKGLKKVLEEWQNDTFVAKEGDEDIHTGQSSHGCAKSSTNIGGKLHTGRSRNDQVATDTRMWLRKELTVLRKHLRTLIEVAIDRAEKEVDRMMPDLRTCSRADGSIFALVVISRRGLAKRRHAFERFNAASEHDAAREWRVSRESIWCRSTVVGERFEL